LFALTLSIVPVLAQSLPYKPQHAKTHRLQ
jgi:hypothetical protein